MRVDAFAIRLRPRANFEAADLGVRLCQAAARSLFPCYFVVLLPVTALALASFEIALCDGLLVQWLLDPDATPSGEQLVTALGTALGTGRGTASPA